MNEREIHAQLREAPAAADTAAFNGAARVRAYNRRKKRLVRGSVALTAMLVLALGLMRFYRAPTRTDPVVAGELTVPEATQPTQSGEVYAHPQDKYYHRDENCPQRHADAVRMPIETAREFGLLPCPICVGEEAAE